MGASVEGRDIPSRTSACRRRQTRSARPSLCLFAAPDAWRSALYTSHKIAFNQSLMTIRASERVLEVDSTTQAFRESESPLIRDVYNAECVALGFTE
jgi:hypothetical protein